MDRKTFLITVWKKALKPLLLIAVIFFCLKFMYNIFMESGTERFLTILILSFAVLWISAHSLGQIFKAARTKIYARLSASTKRWISIIGKFLNYVAPLILGMIVYHFWQEDWKAAVFVLGLVLIERITLIIKEKKQAAN